MSRLRANQITNENANGAPNFPHGLTVTGIITATNTQTTFSNIVVGSAVTANSQGIDVTGIVTATSFKGDGSSLTGIDATQIATGNTKVQTVASRIDSKIDNVGILTVTAAGANITGVVTASSFSGSASGLSGTGKLLKVHVATYTTSVTCSGGGEHATGLEIVVHPTALGSKFIVRAYQQGQVFISNDPSCNWHAIMDRKIGSGSFTEIYRQNYLGSTFPTNARETDITPCCLFDSPSYNAGESITYKMLAGIYTSNYGLKYTAQNQGAGNGAVPSCQSVFIVEEVSA